MLKYELDTVPEELTKFYQKDEATGKFRLLVDGVVPQTQFEETKTKLNEFRNTNNALKKQLEELSDFEQVVGADGKMTKDGVKTTIENLVQARVQQLKQKLEADLAEKEKLVNQYHSRLSEVLISDAVKAAALSHGVVSTAIDDVVARARTTFKVDENLKVISVSSEGDADGNPLNVESFVASLKEKAPHLFARSEGTGTFNRSRSTINNVPDLSRGQRLAQFAKK